MTFKFTHASGNMFATTSKRQQMYRSVHGDVITHSEASKDHAYIAALPTAQALYDELAIRWDPAKFTTAGPSVPHRVMVGGKRGTGARGDTRRRGPNRYVLAQPLREKATGQVWLIVTHHAIAKADTSAKWRRGLRASAFREVGAFIKEMHRRYPTARVVVTGDWNTIGTVNLGAGLTEIRTPGTYGRLRYDRVQVSAGVRASGLTAYSTVLDHRALSLTLAATGAVTPTPAPTPAPTPVPPKPAPKPTPTKGSHMPLQVPFIAARWHGGTQTPKAIVIHGTVSPCMKGGARSVAKFFADHSQPTSAHYVVDPGETVQCVGDHTIAYHCGYNTGSISFELCDPQTGSGKRWGDANHKAMLDRAARDVATTCLAYGIEIKHTSVADLKARGPHGIYGHNDSRLAFGHTTHSDPGPDFPWADFIAAVKHYAGSASDYPIPAKEAGMNHVEYGRKLIEAGLKELAQADGREVVDAQAKKIEAALAVMPEK